MATKQRGHRTLRRLAAPVKGAIITVSDHVHSGERPNKAAEFAREQLATFGVVVDTLVVVPEDIVPVREAIASALMDDVALLVTVGGTGIGARDITPEATEPFIDVRLDTIAWHICYEGLQHTELASLSRGFVGITERGTNGAVVVNAPGSRGGVEDSIAVIGPLLPHLLEQLDAEKYPLGEPVEE